MAKQRRSEDDFARDLKERRLTRAQEFTREGGGHVAFSKFGGASGLFDDTDDFLQLDGRRRGDHAQRSGGTKARKEGEGNNPPSRPSRRRRNWTSSPQGDR
jgi:hypothetical protein